MWVEPAFADQRFRIVIGDISSEFARPVWLARIEADPRTEFKQALEPLRVLLFAGEVPQSRGERYRLFPADDQVILAPPGYSREGRFKVQSKGTRVDRGSERSA